MADTSTSMEFKLAKEFVRTDSRGRVVLGEALAGKRFQLLTNGEGEVLLRPVVAIPQSEAWLYDNPPALSSVRRGLSEARRGKLNREGPDLKSSEKLVSELED